MSRVWALAFTSLLSVFTMSIADAQPTTASALGLPPVPTTKVLAIGRLAANATPEAMKAVMGGEVRDTVRLYLGGRFDQWYTRKDRPGVVFVLNVTDLKEAHDMLEQLPLGKAGLMSFDLIPIGPLAPLGLLMPLAPAPGEAPK